MNRREKGQWSCGSLPALRAIGPSCNQQALSGFGRFGHVFGFLAIAIALVVVRFSSPAQSVPPLVNYQGRLANTDGTPFPTSDYEMQFVLYDAPVGGSNIWGPQIFDGVTGVGHAPRLPVVQGFFNAMLGPVDTSGRSILDAFDASNCFVQVRLGNRDISSRQQILTTPFAARAANGSPPGTIVAFGGTEVPDGWLLCDGRPLRGSEHPRLFRAIRTNWGDAAEDADPATDFRLPDLRGIFLRGVDGVANRDPNRAERGARYPGGNRGNDVGSFQEDEFESHNHGFYEDRFGFVAPVGQQWITINSGTLGGQRGTEFRGGAETRPRNSYVHYIIKE